MIEATMQDLLAETSVVGGCLKWPEYAAEAVAILKPGDFVDSRLRDIWRCVDTVLTASGRLDVTAIVDELKRSGTLKRVGGQGAVIEICESVPAGATVPNATRIVSELARSRRLDCILGTAQYGLRNGKTLDETLAAAQSAFDDVADPSTSKAVSLGEAFDEAATDAARIMETGEAPTILTGLAPLDRMTGGMAPSEQIVLAARPSVGKTTMALNIAVNVARQGHGVVFYSMEMRAKNLAINAQARLSGLRRWDIYNGGLTRESLERFQEAGEALRALPFWIVEDPGAMVRQVAGMAQLAARRHKLSLLVIDYLQLMRVEKADSRNLEIGGLARELKRIALERDMAVLTLSQLNRGIEHREDNRPRLADLRDSGEIEAHADQVWMLSRPCRDLEPEEARSRNAAGKRSQDNYGLVYVRKHRNGETGRVELGWDVGRMAFLSEVPMSTEYANPPRGKSDE